MNDLARGEMAWQRLEAFLIGRFCYAPDARWYERYIAFWRVGKHVKTIHIRGAATAALRLVARREQYLRTGRRGAINV